MSFLSDLFHGNFGNLGRDITQAPSSFVRDIKSEAPWMAAAAALALPFIGPEIGAGLGLTGLGADLFAGGAGAADAALAAGDIGAAGAADALAMAPDALAVAPEVGAADAFTGLDLSGGMGMGQAAADASIGGATPAGFAATDAELTGGITGAGTTAAPTGAPATGGGGIMQSLGLGNISPLKAAIGLAPLGLTLARGEPGLPGQVGPAVANATALAQQGGNLNAAQNATIQNMRQDLVNASRQALFNQGVQNPEADTRWPQMLTQIDNQLVAATQQMIQQNIQNSLAGDQQLLQIAQLQMQSDQAFTNNLVRATAAMGTAFGMGGGGLKLVAA